jgi:ribonuclease HI
MIEVWTDGLCEPVNPGGICCIGYVIKRQGRTIDKGSEVIGRGKDMTNNVAEYSALVRALERIRELGLEQEKVVVRSDSSLLVNQMRGVWKVKKPRIKPLYEKATGLARGIDVAFQWIPREENREADQLTRAAYESAV